MSDHRTEIHSGEFRQSRHYPVAAAVEDVAAQSFSRFYPDAQWPPVNAQFADVYRLAAWRLLTPLTVVAALDCSVLTSREWLSLNESEQSEWIAKAQGTNSLLARTAVGAMTAESVAAI
jgi:hypothetical protein